jgi:hypothetical protein
MEDLARIVMVMFVAWITSGIVLAGLAWAAPRSWNPALRIGAMGIAAVLFVFLTSALFGVTMGAAAAVPTALIAYLGYKRG